MTIYARIYTTPTCRRNCDRWIPRTLLVNMEDADSMEDAARRAAAEYYDGVPYECIPEEEENEGPDFSIVDVDVNTGKWLRVHDYLLKETD